MLLPLQGRKKNPADGDHLITNGLSSLTNLINILSWPPDQWIIFCHKFDQDIIMTTCPVSGSFEISIRPPWCQLWNQQTNKKCIWPEEHLPNAKVLWAQVDPHRLHTPPKGTIWSSFLSAVSSVKLVGLLWYTGKLAIDKKAPVAFLTVTFIFPVKKATNT